MTCADSDQDIFGLSSQIAKNQPYDPERTFSSDLFSSAAHTRAPKSTVGPSGLLSLPDPFSGKRRPTVQEQFELLHPGMGKGKTGLTGGMEKLGNGTQRLQGTSSVKSSLKKPEPKQSHNEHATSAPSAIDHQEKVTAGPLHIKRAVGPTSPPGPTKSTAASSVQGKLGAVNDHGTDVPEVASAQKRKLSADDSSLAPVQKRKAVNKPRTLSSADDVGDGTAQPSPIVQPPPTVQPPPSAQRKSARLAGGSSGATGTDKSV